VEIISKVKTVFSKHEEHSKMICGDFNFPPTIVRWKNAEIGMTSCVQSGKNEGQVHERKESFRKLDELAEDNLMIQIVRENTRGSNLLDLIYTDETEAVEMCKVCEMTSISDHRAIITKVSWGNPHVQECEKKVSKPEIARLNLQNLDWESVNTELMTIDWENQFNKCSDVPHMKEKLIETLVTVLKNNGSLENRKKVTKKSIPLKRRRLFRKKGKIEKRLEKTAKEKGKTKLLKSLAEVTKLLRKSYEDETEAAERKVIQAIKKALKLSTSLRIRKEKP